MTDKVKALSAEPLSDAELAEMRANREGWSLLPRRLLATIAARDERLAELEGAVERVERLCDAADMGAQYSGNIGRNGFVITRYIRNALAGTEGDSAAKGEG